MAVWRCTTLCRLRQAAVKVPASRCMHAPGQRSTGCRRPGRCRSRAHPSGLQQGKGRVRKSANQAGMQGSRAASGGGASAAGASPTMDPRAPLNFNWAPLPCKSA